MVLKPRLLLHSVILAPPGRLPVPVRHRGTEEVVAWVLAQPEVLHDPSLGDVPFGMVETIAWQLREYLRLLTGGSLVEA